MRRGGKPAKERAAEGYEATWREMKRKEEASRTQEESITQDALHERRREEGGRTHRKGRGKQKHGRRKESGKNNN